jgi:hypothetical protein
MILPEPSMRRGRYSEIVLFLRGVDEIFAFPTQEFAGTTLDNIKVLLSVMPG